MEHFVFVNKLARNVLLEQFTTNEVKEQQIIRESRQKKRARAVWGSYVNVAVHLCTNERTKRCTTTWALK